MARELDEFSIGCCRLLSTMWMAPNFAQGKMIFFRMLLHVKNIKTGFLYYVLRIILSVNKNVKNYIFSCHPIKLQYLIFFNYKMCHKWRFLCKFFSLIKIPFANHFFSGANANAVSLLWPINCRYFRVIGCWYFELWKY